MTLRTALMLVSLAPAALPAQEPRDTVILTPVVVTATRIPTPADAVTAAVTVISGAVLRAQGIRTVLDALRDVPAAAVVQTGSFGGVTSLFLRGGQSKYVKVLVDGVAVNDPGGAFDFAHLTTDNVHSQRSASRRASHRSSARSTAARSSARSAPQSDRWG